MLRDLCLLHKTKISWKVIQRLYFFLSLKIIHFRIELALLFSESTCHWKVLAVNVSWFFDKWGHILLLHKNKSEYSYVCSFLISKKKKIICAFYFCKGKKLSNNRCKFTNEVGPKTFKIFHVDLHAVKLKALYLFF